MRQPRATLAPIGAESLQPFLDVVGERSRATGLVLEDEHPDAPRLSITQRCEADRSCLRDSVAERSHDRVELACPPMAEERERDVQVLARHEPDARELVALPTRDLFHDVVGHA